MKAFGLGEEGCNTLSGDFEQVFIVNGFKYRTTSSDLWAVYKKFASQSHHKNKITIFFFAAM